MLATRRAVRLLWQFLETKERLVVLTGAGISTESGIPDYRSPNGSYSKGHVPIQHDEFVQSAAKRARYWGLGGINTVVTQNVDGLHQQAGSRRVLELHGNMRRVACLECGFEMCRSTYHESLRDANRAWYDEWIAPRAEQQPPQRQAPGPGHGGSPSIMRADADADLEADFSGLVPPQCQKCGGVMKPTVVFFGANVPKATTAAATAAVEHCDGLLVVGTSLQVFSSFRLARLAANLSLPICIVNMGPTRVDEQIPEATTLRLDARAGAVLPLACDPVLMRTTMR